MQRLPLYLNDDDDSTEMRKVQAQQLAADLALQVINLSRNSLLVSLRFLDEALFRLTPVKTPAPTTFATDGHTLQYAVDHVLKRYKSEKNAVTRDYLHIVLHCIFRHTFVSTLLDIRIWDVSVDVAVESIINSLELNCLTTRRETMQQQVIAELKSKIKPITAEKLYHYFLMQKLSDQKIIQLSNLFYSDDHVLWYKNNDQEIKDKSRKVNNPQHTQNNSKDSQGENLSDKVINLGESKDTSDCSAQDDSKGSLSFGSLALVRGQLEQEWRNISERIETDLETASYRQGTVASGMIQQLKELNRERYDYTAFLKKFGVQGEVMKVNDDEYDYIFYTYGLSLYGNMPLVEPLEYKDVNRIREFVIAIDTSGSTAGTLVLRFLQKTYNILMSSESFFSKIILWIIQCDAEIQESAKITTKDEFAVYMKKFVVKGLGGTDFRPVFSYVEELIDQREFSNLRGLIYFTDGYGIFPAKKPSYETAFVFIQEEFSKTDVPPWAIKLILDAKDV